MAARSAYPVGPHPALLTPARPPLLGAHGLRSAFAAQIDRLHEGARLDEVGAAIRSLFLARPLPAPLRDELLAAYDRLAAEDLPEASFAGPQETYLNVRGRQADERRPGAGGSGPGETVVGGRVDPDECTVFEPSMKDPALGPVIDVRTGSKRVKTVYAEAGLTRTVDTRTTSAPTGLDRFPRGGVLVTGVTDPDREPVMKRAAAIVTDHGSRTSHAAIVSRELGVPAVVGTGNGTRVLRDGGQVTVSCAYVMAEIPANIILAEDFARRFDGFSIGSNDLTQLTLGVDRDSEALAHVFDESDPAAVRSIRQPAGRAHVARRPAGLCGRRPSDNPSFAAVLVDAGLDSVSVAPDSFSTVKRHIARAEKTVHAAGHDRGE